MIIRDMHKHLIKTLENENRLNIARDLATDILNHLNILQIQRESDLGADSYKNYVPNRK